MNYVVTTARAEDIQRALPIMADSIHDALYKMGRNAISHLPVVEENDNGKIIGTLNKKDVMAVYNRAVLGREGVE